MLVVQRVRVTYTKRHRGMPGAATRAALPRAFVLSRSDGALVFEAHELSERDDSLQFSHHVSEESASARIPEVLRERHLEICVRERDVEVRVIRVDGQPQSRPKHEPLRLALGVYGRAMTNGRYVGEHGQWYEEDTYNVALVEDLEADVFIRSEPAATVDDRVDLF